MSDVGRKVRITSSARHFYGDSGKVREVRPGRSSPRYLIERDKPGGCGLRSFWAARSEFEFDDASALTEECLRFMTG